MSTAALALRRRWHHGHRWQAPAEIRAPKAGRYEHGCGIYLTNVWSRAADYAKGGGSVLRLTSSPA